LLISIVFILLGDFSYLIDTIKGRVRPNRITWLLWGLISVIIFLAELSKGVGIFSFLTLAIGLTPFAIFFASYFNKKAVWRLTGFDYVCGVLSALGLIFWYFSKDGNIAILFTTIANFFVALPTYKKAYTNPETESYMVYLLNAVGTGVGLITLETWNFASAVYPVYVFVGCSFLVVLVKFKLGKRLSK
jgi:hypothetical protein